MAESENIEAEIENYDNLNAGISAEKLEYLLRSCQAIKRFKIHGHRIKDSSTFLFLKNHQLKSICIEGLTSFSCKNILQNINCNNVTDLSLRESFIVDTSVLPEPEEFSYLHCFESLTALDLSFTNLDSNALENICYQLEWLRELYISRTYINDLLPITRLDQLIALDISFCSNFEKCTNIEVLMHLRSLTFLDMSQVFYTDYQQNVLRQLLISHAWPKMTHLNISAPWILDENIIT